MTGTDWYLDPVPLLLHAVGAALLALLGVLLARQVAHPSAGPDGRAAVGAGWVLGPAAVALGALALVGYWAVTSEPADHTYTDEAGATSPYLVSVVAPALVLLWALVTWRARAVTEHFSAGPGVVLQALGVWVVTLPLQAALCADDPSVPLVLLGTTLAVVGTVLVARPGATSTDVGDVLVALGVWLVAAASWPGGWSYASPLVVGVLVLVRRSHRPVS